MTVPGIACEVRGLRALCILLLSYPAFACGGSSMRNAAAPSYGGEAMALESSGAQAAAPLPGDAAGTAPMLQEQLVVEGQVTWEVAEVPAAAQQLHRWLAAHNGRVVRESLSGGSRAWSGSLKVRLPPAQVPELLTWLGEQGTIQRKWIEGTDVSRTLFDQELALQNLTLTLSRLRELLERGELAMKDILEIEKEMTRIRGEIEAIKGSRRYLRDRVALATLDIEVTRSRGTVLGPHAKFHPGPRLASLTLLDAEGRTRTRLGGGVALHFAERGSLELDIFPRVRDEQRAVLATVGGDTYSDFLGGGRNSFLNLYLGMRIGYAYLESNRFAAAGTVGLELFKHEHILVDLNLRAMTLIGDDNIETVFVAGGAIVVPF